VILVGEDAASQVYVRNKVNACAQAGFHSEKITYAPDVDPQVVLTKIAELNADPQIHGIPRAVAAAEALRRRRGAQGDFAPRRTSTVFTPRTSAR
jgi:hypothetical protein